jgi:hypothetical protein
MMGPFHVRTPPLETSRLSANNRHAVPTDHARQIEVSLDVEHLRVRRGVETPESGVTEAAS